MILLKRSFIKHSMVVALTGLSGVSFAQSVQQAPQQHAASANIILQPTKCVSLRQGQVCFADVDLKWNTSQPGHYCLKSNTQTAPLQCWNSVRNGQFSGEVSADENVVFTLTKHGDDKVLAHAEMELAWVYKKKRSVVSWRVF